MDKIVINGLLLSAIVGVFPQEREQKQDLLLDLEVATNVARASQQDDLPDALNYATLTQSIVDFISNSRFQLLETLAEKTAAHILAYFDTPWLRLKITKKPFDMPYVSGVSVVIERTR